LVLGAPRQSSNELPSANAEGVELAQAGLPGAESVGLISALEGTVSITRADGTKVKANDGDPIFQGDIIETGGGGAIGITFADQSTFSLADQGHMVIDEMVYDPGSQSGKSVLSVTEGIFTFVSGQIAKTGIKLLKYTYPIPTIGMKEVKRKICATLNKNNIFTLLSIIRRVSGMKQINF